MEIQEKLQEIDNQITEQYRLYDALRATEYMLKDNWLESSLYREREIFDKVHEIQTAKLRLITGEKLPEIIYRDREVPKYITTKEVHVFKSGIATLFMWAILLAGSAASVLYGLGYFEIIIKQ